MRKSPMSRVTRHVEATRLVFLDLFRRDRRMIAATCTSDAGTHRYYYAGTMCRREAIHLQGHNDYTFWRPV